MKIAKLTLLTIVTTLVAACSSSKKASTSVASSAPGATSTKPPLIVTKSGDGIYPPGNEELSAIQIKHKDVTLNKLQEGYKIYTEGACINCHSAQSIYAHAEEKWEGIVDDMAQKANISDEQKDAVYKYVLAIKATQAK